MNYTEKYHLPQWVESDRIMMEDFNAAMAILEEGLTAVREDAGSGSAVASAAAAQAKVAADRAQSTADSAATAAQNAQATANLGVQKADSITAAAYTPTNKPYIIGSYTGNGKYGGSNPTVINVGFRPSAVFITGGDGQFILIPPVTVTADNRLTVTWTASGVSYYNDMNASYQLNNQGAKYGYCVLR